MIMKTVKVSEKGQIAIPTSIRKEMRLLQGDELVIIQKEGKILLEKPESLFDEVDDNIKDLQAASMENLWKTVWDNKKDEKWSKELMNQIHKKGSRKKKY